MDDYRRGFLESLQAACWIGQAKWKSHFKNAQDETLPQSDRDAALSCTCAIGFLVSDMKQLAAQVHRGELDPRKIAASEANPKPFWWATEDGKGCN